MIILEGGKIFIYMYLIVNLFENRFECINVAPSPYNRTPNPTVYTEDKSQSVTGQNSKFFFRNSPCAIKTTN